MRTRRAGVFALLAAAGALWWLLGAPALAAPVEGDIREVLLGVLAVRVGSGLAPGTVIDTLRRGQTVEVLVREDAAGRVKVRTPSGEVGMVPACFLRPVSTGQKPAVKQPPEPLSGDGVITAAAVNFRQSPAVDTANLMAPLYRNTRVRLLSREGYYLRVVREDGLTGYVPARFVEPVTQVEYTDTPAGPVLPPEPVYTPRPVYCTVTARTLRLREQPSADSAQTGTLQRNEQLTLLEPGEKFFLVRTDSGLTGWASAKYLTIVTPPTGPPEPGTANAYYLVTERVNFRSSPEIARDNRIDRLDAGTLLRFIEASGEFWKVETADGQTGYCACRYLMETEKTFATEERP